MNGMQIDENELASIKVKEVLRKQNGKLKTQLEEEKQNFQKLKFAKMESQMKVDMHLKQIEELKEQLASQIDVK